MQNKGSLPYEHNLSYVSSACVSSTHSVSTTCSTSSPKLVRSDTPYLAPGSRSDPFTEYSGLWEFGAQHSNFELGAGKNERDESCCDCNSETTIPRAPVQTFHPQDSRACLVTEAKYRQHSGNRKLFGYRGSETCGQRVDFGESPSRSDESSFVGESEFDSIGVCLDRENLEDSPWFDNSARSLRLQRLNGENEGPFFCNDLAVVPSVCTTYASSGDYLETEATTYSKQRLSKLRHLLRRGSRGTRRAEKCCEGEPQYKFYFPRAHRSQSAFVKAH